MARECRCGRWAFLVLAFAARWSHSHFAKSSRVKFGAFPAAGLPSLAPKASELEVDRGYGTGSSHEYVEARRHPRYKFEADIRVYARNAAVVRGHTVDISESGISAMLRVEVPIRSE